MSRKRFKITALTLTLLLMGTTAAYAWTMTGTSTIDPGIITMNGYVITSSDQVCDDISSRGWFYRDGTLVDQKSTSQSDVAYQQLNLSDSNRPGTQAWAVSGLHTCLLNGEELQDVTSTSLDY